MAVGPRTLFSQCGLGSQWSSLAVDSSCNVLAYSTVNYTYKTQDLYVINERAGGEDERSEIMGHQEKPSPLKRSYLEIISSKLVLISTNWNYLQFGRSPSLIFTLEIIYANLAHNYLPLFRAV